MIRQDHYAQAVRQAIGDAEMVAPDLVNLEVLSVLRGDEVRADVLPRRAATAVTDLSDALLRTVGTNWVIEGI